MAKIISDITISLDGFSAGPNVSHENPMGIGGERLHHWIFDGTEINAKQVEAMHKRQGAVILGKRTFDIGERHWGGNTPFGTPSFVLTHRSLDKKITSKGQPFTFVNSGIEAAVSQAKIAAGDQDVLVMGGAETMRQLIKAGLIEEMRIRIVSVLLGSGTRLFEGMRSDQIELTRTELIEGNDVTHLTFRFKK